MNTGDKGVMVIQDKTDTVDKTVDLFLQSTAPVLIPQLPWTYSIDGVMQPWKSFSFKFNAARQHLGLIYVGRADTFTLHLGATGKPQLDGPTDFTVQLNQGGEKTISVKVGAVWKQAVCYVNVEGVWKPAAPWVMAAGTWKEAT